MYVVCNVTYALVEYSVGLNKELNDVLLSLPAKYLGWDKTRNGMTERNGDKTRNGMAERNGGTEWG